VRLHLFVQVDGAWAKFEGILGPLGLIPWQRCPAALKTHLGEYGVTSGQQAAVESADRWWLVECENAEAGRTLIALSEVVAAVRRKFGESAAPVLCNGAVPPGRVIATGGRLAGDRRAHPRLDIRAPLTPGDIPGRNA
jgi:hypothetical protein